MTTPPILMPVRAALAAALLLGATACTSTTARAPHPPAAPARVVTDDYHGTKVADPYRHFENFTDPGVQAWVREQADSAERALRAIPGRDELLARIRELDTGAPYRVWVVRRWPNGDLHYKKRLAADNLDKLYFRDAETGQERLLIDPERLTPPPGGGHYSLSFCVPSPDGRYVAYGLAASGSEQDVLHVLDVAAGKDLPDVIDRIEGAYTDPDWLPDSSGFVYSRRQKLGPDDPPTEGFKNTRAFLHRLGTDPEADPVVFSKDVPGPKAAPMADADFPSVLLTPGSSWAIGQIKHGDTDELTLYATPADSLGRPDAAWQKLCDVEDAVSDFAVRGDDAYLLAAAGAPRRYVVRASLAAPGAVDVVLPEGEAVVGGISAARDALYVELLDGGNGRVARLPFDDDARLEHLDLPAGMSSASFFGARPDIDGVFVWTSSWTRGGRVYAYDPQTKTLTDTGLQPQGKFDNPEGIESHEVLVPSHDGVKVPLSIVHKSGLKLDGSNPTLVVGYGSYGISLSPHFDPTDLAWLERGGVIAVAHVRGGGEFGVAWHHAGRMATKPNTWKDFIACCEYLVEKGYTSPPKLAGQGGSAGGILIGRAITERPDLFAAAIINVGCTDLLRAEITTNGVPNIQEFGSVVTRPGFDALLAMSPYHHVKDGVKYPAVLLTHGVNDPRVDAWMSAKMTARLQAATASDRPILFRVDYQAGHGIGSTRAQRQEQAADEWAFLLWQLGAVAAAAPAAAVDGDFTIEWRQMIASAERAEPAMTVGGVEVAVRPLPKDKPKDPPRAALFVGEALRSRTLIHPGKWYHLALVGRGGNVQLFANGFPDGEPVAVKLSGETKPAVDDVQVTGRALAPDELLARFKDRLPPRQITVVAHRGVHRHAPENTKISYVQALQAKAPVVEVDTALTKDGVIVLMHDPTVDRTTNGTGKVADMLAADVVKLDAGSWKHERYAGEPVPLLADVAELCRGKAVVMLDLKAEGQGKAIADWLAASKFPRDQVILAPWTDEEGAALRTHVKDVPMIRLTSKIPVDTIEDAYFAKMKTMGFSGFSVNWEHLTQAFVDAAKENGMTVYVWTVNDDPDIAGAALLGVDSVITDDPAAAMKTLDDLARK